MAGERNKLELNIALDAFGNIVIRTLYWLFAPSLDGNPGVCSDFKGLAALEVGLIISLVV